MEEKNVKTEALTIIQKATGLQVVDSESYRSAGSLWQDIKAMKDQVNESFRPIIEKAHAAHKEALAQKAKIFDPLDNAGRAVKAAMEKYDREQEAIRQAERRRIEAEMRAAEEERRLQAAIAAENSGRQEQAEKILDIPISISVPKTELPPSAPKMEGGPVYRTVWKVEVTDESILPREMMVPDLVKLGQLARVMKEKFSVPGARAYSERV